MVDEVSSPRMIPLTMMTPIMKYSNQAELTSLDARSTCRAMEMKIALRFSCGGAETNRRRPICR